MKTGIKEKWVIDPIHSEISFKIRHLMITNVKGSFKDFNATIYSTGDDFLSAEIECWIDAASVETGSADRDAHIKGPEFFDAATFPQILFEATGYENVDNDGSYELIGVLTIKGIPQPVTLDVEFGGIVKDPWGNEKAGFTINGKVSRQDWGLNWNTTLETGGVLISDEIKISCDIQLMRGE